MRTRTCKKSANIESSCKEYYCSSEVVMQGVVGVEKHDINESCSSESSTFTTRMLQQNLPLFASTSTVENFHSRPGSCGTNGATSIVVWKKWYRTHVQQNVPDFRTTKMAHVLTEFTSR